MPPRFDAIRQEINQLEEARKFQLNSDSYGMTASNVSDSSKWDLLDAIDARLKTLYKELPMTIDHHSMQSSRGNITELTRNEEARDSYWVMDQENGKRRWSGDSMDVSENENEDVGHQNPGKFNVGHQNSFVGLRNSSKFDDGHQSSFGGIRNSSKFNEGHQNPFEGLRNSSKFDGSHQNSSAGLQNSSKFDEGQQNSFVELRNSSKFDEGLRQSCKLDENFQNVDMGLLYEIVEEGYKWIELEACEGQNYGNYKYLRTEKLKESGPRKKLKNEDEFRVLIDYIETQGFDDGAFKLITQKETNKQTTKKVTFDDENLAAQTFKSGIPRLTNKPSIPLPNSAKRAARNQSQLTRSVPNFTDLKKENTKPSPSSARKYGFGYGKNNQSISPSKAKNVEENRRKNRDMVKSFASVHEFKSMSSCSSSDRSILSPIKASRVNNTSNMLSRNFSMEGKEGKPFLKKGGGAGGTSKSSISPFKTSPNKIDMGNSNRGSCKKGLLNKSPASTPVIPSNRRLELEFQTPASSKAPRARYMNNAEEAGDSGKRRLLFTDAC